MNCEQNIFFTWSPSLDLLGCLINSSLYSIAFRVSLLKVRLKSTLPLFLGNCKWCRSVIAHSKNCFSEVLDLISNIQLQNRIHYSDVQRTRENICFLKKFILDYQIKVVHVIIITSTNNWTSLLNWTNCLNGIKYENWKCIIFTIVNIETFRYLLINISIIFTMFKIKIY